MKEKNEYKEKIYKGFLEKYPHIHPQIIFVTLFNSDFPYL